MSLTYFPLFSDHLISYEYNSCFFFVFFHVFLFLLCVPLLFSLEFYRFLISSQGSEVAVSPALHSCPYCHPYCCPQHRWYVSQDYGISAVSLGSKIKCVNGTMEVYTVVQVYGTAYGISTVLSRMFSPLLFPSKLLFNFSTVSSNFFFFF